MTLRRVGVFSGTFDPIHAGHIAFGQAALEQCNLDVVVYMPERRPRGKLGMADFEHRLHMTKLATEDYDRLTALETDDDQFTVERTLPYLQTMYAGADIILLIGSDVVRTFHYRWPGLEQLVAQVEFAICLRGDETEQSVRQAIERVDLPMQYSIIATDYAQTSATEVRRGNAQGAAKELQQYILRHNLYR